MGSKLAIHEFIESLGAAPPPETTPSSGEEAETTPLSGEEAEDTEASTTPAGLDAEVNGRVRQP